MSIVALHLIAEPPIAETKEMKKIVRIGDNVKLQCPMSGFPAPLIDWTKDGETVNNYAWTR